MVEETAKKIRKGRGISNDTQAVSELRFHERNAARNGLFVGHLESVQVLWSTNADGKTFTGLKVPRLEFHFESNESKVTERKHVRFVLRPVESSTETMPGGNDEWKVNNVFKGIKHMLDVFYLRGRNFTDEEVNALNLGFDDIDDEGNYVMVEPQEVLDGYAFVFENVASMMNGTFGLKDGETPKPCFKDANGNPLPVWMKLLRYRKSRNKGWQKVGQSGELAFDGFIGSGLVELQRANENAHILSIDPSFESIMPQKEKENKLPSVGGVSAGVVAGGIPGAGGLPAYAATNGIGDGAAEAAGQEGDMPF